MADEEEQRRQNRLKFAFDYYFSMLYISILGQQDFDPNADAIILFFLVDWGLTKYELDDLKELIKNSPDTNRKFFDSALKKIYEYVKKDKTLMERCVIQQFALMFFYNDNEHLDEHKNFLKRYFELSPIDYVRLMERGASYGWAISGIEERVLVDENARKSFQDKFGLLDNSSPSP